MTYSIFLKCIKILNANINNGFNISHLGGPVILFIWLLLFTVSLDWCPDCTIGCSILSTDRSRRAVHAKRVSSFAVLDTSTLCSVVCKHSGQILAVAKLLNNPGAGKTVGWQDTDVLRLGATIS